MDSVDNSRKLNQDLEIGRLNLIRQELMIVATFLDTAEATNSDETRDGTVERARKAYDSALKFLVDSEITPAGRAKIEPELQRLRERIDKAKGSGQP